MSGKIEKKIRKAAKQEIKTDCETLAEALYRQKLITRIAYAFKIVFKIDKWKFVITQNYDKE